MEFNSVKNKLNVSKNDLRLQKSDINNIIKMSNYNLFGARKIRDLVRENINNSIVNKYYNKKNKFQNN